MKPRLLALILGVLFLVAYWLILSWMAPVNEIHPREHNPKYHGADMLHIGWKGEVTALRWEGKRYRVMWRRK